MHCFFEILVIHGFEDGLHNLLFNFLYGNIKLKSRDEKYMSKKKKVNIMNVDFVSIHSNELVKDLNERINRASQTFIVTANPEIVMHANEDSEYLSTVNKADYVIADGYGIILGSKILGNEIPERIAGFDLMAALLEKGNDEGWSVYFLGAKEEVISKAVGKIKEQFPYLNIVGWHNGYADVNSIEFQKSIASKKPDLIFVGLGFPAQEKWIANSLPFFEKGLFMGVGGSFDVWAGAVKRAPEVWQRLHIEWLYRLIQQPKRWRRMAVLPLFVIKIMKERLKR